MKVVEENFRQLFQKVLWLWCKQFFVYIDEDFAINWICPEFLSLLMTGIIRIGVTERGSFKKYSGVVHIPFFEGYMNNIKLSLTYSEFTVHMQNQLKAGSFVGTKAGLSHDVQFSIMHVLWNVRFWDDPTNLTHDQIRRDFYYIWTSHPSL